MRAFGALRAFDLAVEMRCARTVRSELDVIISQSILKLFSNELTASVALDALNGEGELRQEVMFHKMSGVDGTARGVKGQNPHPSAIINGGELIQAFTYFAGVNLHSISGNRTGRESDRSGIGRV